VTHRAYAAGKKTWQKREKQKFIRMADHNGNGKKMLRSKSNGNSA